MQGLSIQMQGLSIQQREAIARAYGFSDDEIAAAKAEAAVINERIAGGTADDSERLLASDTVAKAAALLVALHDAGYAPVGIQMLRAGDKDAVQASFVGGKGPILLMLDGDTADTYVAKYLRCCAQ